MVDVAPEPLTIIASFKDEVYKWIWVKETSCASFVILAAEADAINEPLTMPISVNLSFADCVNWLSDADTTSNLSNLLSKLVFIVCTYSLTAYWVGTVSSPYKPCEFNKVVLLLTSCNTTPTATPFLLNGPIALSPDKLNEFASIVTSPVNWLTAKKSPIFKLPILSTVE